MDANAILRAYALRLKKNKQLADIYRNAASYLDAMEYAKGSGKELAAAIAALTDLTAMSEDEMAQLLDACLKAGYNNISAVCQKAQKSVIRNAGLNIGSLAPEYSPAAARTMAAALIDSEDISFDHLKNLISKEALGIVDSTIRSNAKAEEEMGLTCRIVRKYDDVGLHDKTKWAEPCQWCLAREGEWHNYQDALAAGAFERHPGCGCVITYEVGKTRTWSAGKGTWQNLD